LNIVQKNCTFLKWGHPLLASLTPAMSFLIFFNLGSLCHVHEKNTLHEDDAHPEK